MTPDPNLVVEALRMIATAYKQYESTGLSQMRGAARRSLPHAEAIAEMWPRLMEADDFARATALGLKRTAPAVQELIAAAARLAERILDDDVFYVVMTTAEAGEVDKDAYRLRAALKNLEEK